MNLPDALLAAVKVRALEQGRTATSILEEALRAYLQQPGEAARPVTLPTWRGGSHDGYLIDIGDREALWAALDDAT